MGGMFNERSVGQMYVEGNASRAKIKIQKLHKTAALNQAPIAYQCSLWLQSESSIHLSIARPCLFAQNTTKNIIHTPTKS